MNTPTYTALVAETGFDPTTITPTEPPEVRRFVHQMWQQEAEARCFEGPLPQKRAVRKAAKKVAS